MWRLSISWLLSSPFIALLCDTGAKPFKYFSFACWQVLLSLSEDAEGMLQKKGASLPCSCVFSFRCVFFFLAFAVYGSQWHVGHPVAPQKRVFPSRSIGPPAGFPACLGAPAGNFPISLAHPVGCLPN